MVAVMVTVSLVYISDAGDVMRTIGNWSYLLRVGHPETPATTDTNREA